MPRKIPPTASTFPVDLADDADVVDVNAHVAAWLYDLAFVQVSRQSQFGYKRAAKTVMRLPEPLDTMLGSSRSLPKIFGIGPSSTRVILEVLHTGESHIVETAVEASSNAADIRRRRALRKGFLSRARVDAVLRDSLLVEPGVYKGDLQMHSTWSDGSQPIEELMEGAIARGYQYIAITDHAHGLKIAGGMSQEEVVQQHIEMDHLNAKYAGRCRVIKSIEANILADGQLDVTAEEMASLEIVLAAPHSKLRLTDDQTPRMLAAVMTPGVNILGHPRGRIYGTRPGVTADWDVVFAAAAGANVAVEIDGDGSRQDLDFHLARRALAAGCVFALDSDAHAVSDYRAAEIALAHATLAGIPADRVINTWPVERLLAWAARAQAPVAHRRLTRRKI